MNKFSRLILWPRLAGVAAVYCQTTTTKPDNNVKAPLILQMNQVAELSHKHLLQQTCILSVNSSCQMITIALVALSDASQIYKNELTKMMNLLEDEKWCDDELEKVLIEFRYTIADIKTFYLDSISAMDSALQLGQSSAKISFSVEANTVFNTMSERLYSAEKEFQSCIEDTRIIEDKFTKIMARILDKSRNKDSSEIIKGI